MTGAALQALTPYDRRAGSSRVRVLEWGDRLSSKVDTHTYASLPLAGPGTLLRHPRRVLQAEAELRTLLRRPPERLMLHREASPLSRGSVEVELLSRARFSVYDLDDALHEDTGEGPLYRRLSPKAPKARDSARAADRVVAGNDEIAEWASGHNNDVVIIPSCIEPSSYDVRTHGELADPPRLGWVGSWSTERYLDGIAPALLALHGDLGARLTIVGAAGGSLGDLELMVDRVPWSEAEQRVTLATFDLGLMPVPDNPYTRGKCGYKLLQYLAAGVPAIGSPVGVNRTILAQCGLPAPESADDWYDAIRALLESPAEHRATIGAAARRVALKNYSFAAWQDRWCAAMGLVP